MCILFTLVNRQAAERMRSESATLPEPADAIRLLERLLIEGYTPDDILTLPDEQIEVFVFTGEPLLVRVGSATILGEYRRGADRMTLELAHIDGGGEGVLLVLIRHGFIVRDVPGFGEAYYYLHPVPLPLN